MGSVYGRGKSWVGKFKYQGKTIQKTLGKKDVITKTQAREMVKKIEKWIELDRYELVENKIPTLREFGQEYISHMRDTIKLKSWNRYEYSLNRILALYGDDKLTDITPEKVSAYIRTRQKDAQPATINRELSTLRQIINLAKDWNKFYKENPVTITGLLPENNQVERILTEQEEEKLLEASNERLRPIVISALSTGMRKTELITLKWKNIDFASNMITIDQTNTKSKKTRRIPITPDLQTVLKEQKLKTGKSGFVFLSDKGLPYRFHDSIDNAFYGACKRAGIEGLRFHDLRHTSATRMIEAGASIVAVSKILGHSDIKITMRYAHPENSLVEAVGLLSKKKSDFKGDKLGDI